MKTLRSDLKNRLKNKKFKEIFEQEKSVFEEEKRLIEFGMKLREFRIKKAFSQQELAKKAHVTQQQLSSIESGANATMQTYIRVCHVLNVPINLGKQLVA